MPFVGTIIRAMQVLSESRKFIYTFAMNYDVHEPRLGYSLLHLRGGGSHTVT